VADLAATTEEELAVGIRAGVDVLEAAQMWRRSPQWRGEGSFLRAWELIPAVQRVLLELPEDASVSVPQAAAGPVLGIWWPEHRLAERLLHDAVDRLRVAAIRLPSMVAQCRAISRFRT
jgi:hypothetical protein